MSTGYGRFVVLAQDVKGANESRALGTAIGAAREGQVKAALAELGEAVGKGLGGGHTLGVNLYAQDGQSWVEATQARGALQRGPGFRAVAQVHKRGMDKVAVPAAHQVWGAQEHKVVHPAQAVAGGLAACGLLWGRVRVMSHGHSRPIWEKRIALNLFL
jgi:hypothetical protein